MLYLTGNLFRHCDYTTYGFPITELTRYSDGTEDRIDYEYDEGGAPVKWTESRRNGVCAVTVDQYTDAEMFSHTLWAMFTSISYLGNQDRILMQRRSAVTEVQKTYLCGRTSEKNILPQQTTTEEAATPSNEKL